MDDAEFDRLIARASSPKLIPGIYNYCDRVCARCHFTDRCLSYIENNEEEAQGDRASEPVEDVVRRSLDRSLGMIQVIAERHGIDLSAIPDDGEHDRVSTLGKGDPLVRRAREYSLAAHPIAKALGPLVAARRDRELVEAVDTIAWLCITVSSKTSRAVTGALRAEYDPAEEQTDANGSAKVALLLIDQSREAWRVLMKAGKATGNGTPAKLVGMLDDLEARLRERFPRAMDFVRPGFDEDRP